MVSRRQHVARGAETDSQEDGSDDRRDDKGGKQSLHEDGILDLTKSRLLNPDLSVEDLADDIALVVFSDPRLIFVAIGRPQAVERILFGIVGRRLILVAEEFPGAEMTMVHAMENLASQFHRPQRNVPERTYHAHALPGSKER